MEAQMKIENAASQLRNARRSAAGFWSPDAATKSLSRSLGWHAFTVEGYLSPAQAAFLHELLLARPEVRSILEIGFNAGHSSHAFLAARPDTTIVSFDLGTHSYVRQAKRLIDEQFPGRHTLLLGDSRDTVPAYHAAHPSAHFDLAFIDGGHEYSVASADIRNCQSLVAPGGLVIMDDLLPWRNWGAGPVRAWQQAKQDGMIRELQILQDGEPVTAVMRKASTSAWALGSYEPAGMPG
jgi:predicted O-methyltransferase YrrM